ncbi:MAG TPA: transcriptional regulator NrdR [Syntrophorhabdaceae bacterium]|nr:transcriptional regulator NrdR [Syntrophorhabdaceae bacterium]HPU29369.1 transcriptional regulator NrdR [Syntrophorhabdaceae bacterium]
MKCPFCGYTESKVLDSRMNKEMDTIRRRRECLKCSRRFTTAERLEEGLLVIKKDGRREVFDRAKILNGLKKACEKRPISITTLEKIVSRIEYNLFEKNEREIKCSEIGEMVMDELKKLDEVAYVRFASVYRQFKDINEFMEELKELLIKKDEQ